MPRKKKQQSMCYFCSKVKSGSGTSKGRAVVKNMEPCDTCTELMKEHIMLIAYDEAKTHDPNNPHRTGPWSFVREPVIRKFIGETPTLDKVLKKRTLFVPKELWAKIYGKTHIGEA